MILLIGHTVKKVLNGMVQIAVSGLIPGVPLIHSSVNQPE